MASSRKGLTPFQEEVLRAFFDREKGFFLTGGGALVGYLLRHRFTDDLDLFTLSQDSFERGTFALRDVARHLDADLQGSCVHT